MGSGFGFGSKPAAHRHFVGVDLLDIEFENVRDFLAHEVRSLGRHPEVDPLLVTVPTGNYRMGLHTQMGCGGISVGAANRGFSALSGPLDVAVRSGNVEGQVVIGVLVKLLGSGF